MKLLDFGIAYALGAAEAHADRRDGGDARVHGARAGLGRLARHARGGPVVGRGDALRDALGPPAQRVVVVPRARRPPRRARRRRSCDAPPRTPPALTAAVMRAPRATLPARFVAGAFRRGPARVARGSPTATPTAVVAVTEHAPPEAMRRRTRPPPTPCPGRPRRRDDARAVRPRAVPTAPTPSLAGLAAAAVTAAALVFVALRPSRTSPPRERSPRPAPAVAGGGPVARVAVERAGVHRRRVRGPRRRGGAAARDGRPQWLRASGRRATRRTEVVRADGDVSVTAQLTPEDAAAPPPAIAPDDAPPSPHGARRPARASTPRCRHEALPRDVPPARVLPSRPRWRSRSRRLRQARPRPLRPRRRSTPRPTLAPRWRSSNGRTRCSGGGRRSLFNIAVTQEALGRYVEALASMREFAERAPPAAVRAHRVEVDAALVRLPTRIGTPPRARRAAGARGSRRRRRARPLDAARRGCRCRGRSARDAARAGPPAARARGFAWPAASVGVEVVLEPGRSTPRGVMRHPDATVRVDGESPSAPRPPSPVEVATGSATAWRSPATATRPSPARSTRGARRASGGCACVGPPITSEHAARLAVTANESGLVTALDGAASARASRTRGRHVLRVTRGSFLPWEREVTLRRARRRACTPGSNRRRPSAGATSTACGRGRAVALSFADPGRGADGRGRRAVGRVRGRIRGRGRARDGGLRGGQVVRGRRLCGRARSRGRVQRRGRRPLRRARGAHRRVGVAIVGAAALVTGIVLWTRAGSSIASTRRARSASDRGGARAPDARGADARRRPPPTRNALNSLRFRARHGGCSTEKDIPTRSPTMKLSAALLAPVFCSPPRAPGRLCTRSSAPRRASASST